MKKLTPYILAAIFGLTLTFNAQAQSPEKFNYQAVLRSDGNLVVNNVVDVRFTIHDLTATGTTVYQEIHSTTTDRYGLINVAVGSGEVVAGNFSSINWGGGNKYLQVEVDYGTGNYENLGASQLLSVPYALYAGKTEGNAEGIGNNWNLNGNSGTAPTNFIGTTDDVALRFKVDSIEAGIISSKAPYNTGFGYKTLSSIILDSTSVNGRSNSAFGSNALSKNTTGYHNTAIGVTSLYFNTTGYFNTAIGAGSMAYNTTGIGNTAAGISALAYNTTGTNNTAIGMNALNYSTTGYKNTAIGAFALSYNDTGYANTAIGNAALQFNFDGYKNTALGFNALRNNSDGVLNTAGGAYALNYNSTGDYNSAFGSYALFKNTTGFNNSAYGYAALYSNTSGRYNTAGGYKALYSNTTGNSNTAFGDRALNKNTTGYYNAAFGAQSLSNNTIGRWNASFGYAALISNTTGISNAAFGFMSLRGNTTGNYNTAFGGRALKNNYTGNYNTASGYWALVRNYTGNYNTALGTKALSYNTSSDFNVAIGRLAMDLFSTYTNSSGGRNTAVGANTDIKDNITNATAIGYNAYSNASNKVVLGNPFVNIIGGYANWSNLSDARFKNKMQPLEHGLDFIMQLKPVTYHYNMQKLHNFMEKREGEAEEKDSEWLSEAMVAKAAIQYSGFSAQQVEKAANSIGYDFSGVHAPKNAQDHYTLAYAEFVVPLVKAVQEQQEMIKEQQKLMQNKDDRIQALETELKQLKNTLMQRIVALETKYSNLK